MIDADLCSKGPSLVPTDASPLKTTIHIPIRRTTYIGIRYSFTTPAPLSLPFTFSLTLSLSLSLPSALDVHLQEQQLHSTIAFDFGTLGGFNTNCAPPTANTDLLPQGVLLVLSNQPSTFATPRSAPTVIPIPIPTAGVVIVSISINRSTTTTDIINPNRTEIRGHRIRHKAPVS